MLKKKKQIVWEKWEDPFEAEQFNPEHYEDIDEETYDQLVEESEEAVENAQQTSNQQYKFIVTPFGVFSPEKISIGKHFKFWIGHTNFTISSKIASIIENTEGVEVLNVYTRYRFRIAVGHSFSDRHIMHLINKRINNE